MEHLAPNEILARRSLNEQNINWTGKDARLQKVLELALAQPEPAPMNIDSVRWIALHDAWEQRTKGHQTAESILSEAQHSVEQAVQNTAIHSTSPISIVVDEPPILPPTVQHIRFATDLSKQQLLPLVEHYEQMHPSFHFDLTYEDYTEGLEAERAFIQTASRTDCFTWRTSPTRQAMSTIRDFRPLIEADPNFDLADYPPALLQRFQSGTQLMGLPLLLQMRVLAYNPKIFAVLGLSEPESQMSMEKFTQLAQQVVQAQNKGKYYGYALTFAGVQDVQFFLDTFDAPIGRTTAQGVEPNFTDPSVIEALSTFVMLLHDSSPHTELPGYARGRPMADHIMNGESAMWLTYNLRGFAMPIESAIVAPSFSPKVVAPPQSGLQHGTSDLRVSGMYISSQSTQVDACWQWLSYLSSSLALVDVDSFPARRSLAQSQAFLSQAPPQAIATYTAYIPTFDAPHPLPEANLFDDAQFDPYWLYYALDQSLQGKDLMNELQLAQDRTQAYLICVRQGVAPKDCALSVDRAYEGMGPRGGP